MPRAKQDAVQEKDTATASSGAGNGASHKAPVRPDKAPAKAAPARAVTGKAPTEAGGAAPATKATKATKTAVPAAKAAGKQTSVKPTATKQTGGREIATKETSKLAPTLPGDGSTATTGELQAVDAAAEAKSKRARPMPVKKPEVQDLAASAGVPDDEPRDLFLEHQRGLLMAERRNYTRQAEELRAQADALALEHEPGDVQFDEEGGEGGTANVDRELDLHLSAQAQAAIEEIDAALDKITAGTYGFCESCGSPSPRPGWRRSRMPGCACRARAGGSRPAANEPGPAPRRLWWPSSPAAVVALDQWTKSWAQQA